MPPADPPPEWILRARLDTGTRVRAARKAAQLSQEGLAELLGVERRAVVRIELGIVSAPLDRLVVIAAALGVTPASLLPDWVPEPPNGLPE